MNCQKVKEVISTNGIYIIYLVFLFGCREERVDDGKANLVDNVPFSKIKGKTMGTKYTIVYANIKKENYKLRVDSLLVEINKEVSTFIPDAIISKFNESKTGIKVRRTSHFAKNLLIINDINKNTLGYFDPTVMPLVNYWGFGYSKKNKKHKVDSQRVFSILQNVGYQKIKIQEQEDSFFVKKEVSGVQLDFSSFAKGYGIDEVGRFFEKNGINNYLIEIGGETLVRGMSPKKRPWRLGVNTPESKANKNDYYTTLELTNRAVATSGNYRNFYKKEGQTYSHTINPKTGFSERNSLLSVTVISENCIIADAYATGFMSMGIEKAKIIIEKIPEVEGYFIYLNEKNGFEEYFSSGAKQYFLD